MLPNKTVQTDSNATHSDLLVLHPEQQRHEQHKRNDNKSQSNLAVDSIAEKLGFWPPNLAFLWGTGYLVYYNVTWDHKYPCQMAISFHPTALAGCMSVTDDTCMDRPRYGNVCCNTWNRFQRCHLQTSRDLGYTHFLKSYLPVLTNCLNEPVC